MPSSMFEPIQNISDPLLNKLSSQINAAREQAIVQSVWFQQVDRILTQSSSATAAEVQVAVTQFYTLALEALQQTLNNGAQRAAYIESLRNSMNNMWDERLVTPAEQFFEKAKALYLQIGQGDNNRMSEDGEQAGMSISTLMNNLISPDVERAVSEVYQLRFRNPAQQVYDHSVAAYLALTRKLNQSPDFTSFLNSVQAALGTRYHKQLREPLNELWAALSSRAISDLSRIHAYLDVVKNGRLSLADLYYAGSTTVSGFVYGTWQSVLRRTKGIVDYALPERDEVVLAEHSNLYDSLSINSLRLLIQNRLVQRVYSGYDGVKHISSNYVYPYTLVDPIAISESFASPVVSEARERIESARNVLQARREALQLAIKQYKEAGVNTVSGIAQQATQRVTGSLSQSLSSKLNSLRVAVIGVAEQSKTLILHEPIFDLPSEAVHVLQSLPSILFLTHPHFEGSDAESQLLQRVENLVEATQQLIMWSVLRDDSVIDDIVDESGEIISQVPRASVEDQIDNISGQLHVNSSVSSQGEVIVHHYKETKVTTFSIPSDEKSKSDLQESHSSQIQEKPSDSESELNDKDANFQDDIENHNDVDSNSTVKEIQTSKVSNVTKVVNRKKARRGGKP